MSKIASSVLHQQLNLVAVHTEENKWLTREQTSGAQRQIRRTMSALPLPVNRLGELDSCREVRRKCRAWLKGIESARLQHNQAYTEAILIEYAGSFHQVESSPLNPAQARAVISGEHSLLMLVGTGSGKTSVLVAHTGWLPARNETSPEQVLLLAFGRKATEETDKRIRERLHTEDITTRTFHALALYTIQQSSKKVPIVSRLENDATTRHELFIAEWRKRCSEKRAQMKGWRQWLTEEMQWSVPEGNFWDDEKLQRRLISRLDRQVSLVWMHGGAQAEMITSTPGEIRNLLSRRIKLVAPLLKV